MLEWMARSSATVRRPLPAPAPAPSNLKPSGACGAHETIRRHPVWEWITSMSCCNALTATETRPGKRAVIIQI